MFKANIGCARITAEVKYRDSFKFTPFARLLFSANRVASSQPYCPVSPFGTPNRCVVKGFLLLCRPNTEIGQHPQLIHSLTLLYSKRERCPSRMGNGAAALECGAEITCAVKRLPRLSIRVAAAYCGRCRAQQGESL
jgi:hypothetical protein